MESVARKINTERKIIRISEKRQMTIPQKFYDALNMNDEAECILQNGQIILRPIKENTGGEFAEQILADLIRQGYSGEALLEKFKEMSKKIRPAVEAMIKEAEDIAKKDRGVNMQDIFVVED